MNLNLRFSVKVLSAEKYVAYEKKTKQVFGPLENVLFLTDILTLIFLSITTWQCSGCSYGADLAACLQFWPAVPQSPQVFYAHSISQRYQEVVVVLLQGKADSHFYCRKWSHSGKMERSE